VSAQSDVCAVELASRCLGHIVHLVHTSPRFIFLFFSPRFSSFLLLFLMSIILILSAVRYIPGTNRVSREEASGTTGTVHAICTVYVTASCTLHTAFYSQI
jgi:hypothetical protein